MTAIFNRLKTHFANWREWELNPVVVKELRQSVRSWAVTGMLLLFLAVLFCTALIFLVTQSFEMYMDQSLGSRVFSVFLVILTGASLVFIPVSVGARLAGERQESNLDLLYVTSLTPQRIILGKFLCGVYMVILFFSACMPFMVFTNLLRGIDLPTIFFILLCLFMVLCLAIELAIFLACLPITKVLKVLIAMLGTMTAFGMATSLVGFFFMTIGSGIGSTMGTREFWAAFSISTGIAVAVGLFLHLLSVASISPLSANRALPLRIYMTSIWVLGGALCLYWAFRRHDPRLLLQWTNSSYAFLIMALVVVVSNNDDLSLRVRRQIPVNLAARGLAFLFFNGAAGGLIWLGLLFGTTFAVTLIVFRTLGPASFGWRDDELNVAAMLLYVFAYALTALFLHRRFLARRTPKLAGILSVLLPGAWALVPYIVFFFLNRLSWRTMESNQLGNIFNVFMVKDNYQKMAHIACGGLWLLLMLLLNARWFVHQTRKFKPAEASPAPLIEPPAIVPPPVVPVVPPPVVPPVISTLANEGK